MQFSPELLINSYLATEEGHIILIPHDHIAKQQSIHSELTHRGRECYQNSAQSPPQEKFDYHQW